MHVEDKAEKRRAHTAIPDHLDVAVVGAGLGGLTAAATLARLGLRVACFDSHYVAGGCATQFTRGPRSARYRFDVGLHYIGDCEKDGAIPRILDGLGIGIEYARLDPDGFDTLVFPDLEFRIPASVDLYRDRLLDAFPGERRGIDSYARLLRSIMRATRVLDARDGKMTLRGGLSLALDAPRLARFGNATIAEVFDAYAIRDPKLRAVLLGQSGDYGLPPSKVSAFLHLGLAGHYFRGAYYPKGGGQVIADRIAAAVELAGGTVHLRHAVERILVDERGAASGVRLAPRNGEPARDVRARVVLSNADLKLTLERLVGVEHLPASWVARTRAFEMAGALFITFLGVKADLRAMGMRAANYWQFDDYDVERMYAEDSLSPSGCYVTSATLKDPEGAHRHAPTGIHNVEVMTLVPGKPERWGVSADDARSWQYRNNERYEALKSDTENNLIARLDALFPGTAGAIVHRESASPVSHLRFTGASDGTGYGLAATPAQFMKSRPGYRGPIENLYLCGASTRAGHGVLGALMSGKQAAKRIAEALGRPVEPARSSWWPWSRAVDAPR